MKLRLQNLQSVVQRVVEEEKVLHALKNEISKSLGSFIVTENRDIDAICDDVMHHLDILETSNIKPEKFKTSLLVKMLEHKSLKVRSLAARLAPLTQLYKVADDKSSVVRTEVAKRISLKELNEMVRKFPADEAVSYIYEVRKINESDEFDMYGDKRLGDSGKQNTEQELTDLWYESLAREFVEKYKHEIEASWVTTAVNSYVSAVKATSGVEVDSDKLLDAVYEVIGEHDNETLSKICLSKTYQSLLTNDLKENTFYTMGADDEDDDVIQLINCGFSSTDYINSANQVFSVKEGSLPRSTRKFLLTEGIDTTDVKVPTFGTLPHGMGFRSVDENALDVYCENWNKRQKIEGSHLRLSWSIDQSTDDGIIFEVNLR